MKIVIGLLFMLSAIFAASEDIMDVYLKNGFKGIEEKLDAKLEDKDFWSAKIKDKHTELGYYEKMKYILVADKSKPELSFYEFEDGTFKELDNKKAYVGQNGGMKQKEGDLKTPIGVYNLVTKRTKLDDYYGPLALVTSYPNLYDSLQNRDGSGIWIHGIPSSGERPDNTKGCIAVENDYMKEIGGMIDMKKTVLIVSESGLKDTNKDDIATTLKELYAWRNAWKYSDIKKYLNFYDKNEFRRFDGKDFNQFKSMKEIIFGRNERKSIVFNDINIIPYPNPEGKDMYRVTFSEDYKSDNYAFSGDKELYIELKNGKMKILAER